MKKDNKKALYESIMTSVAKEVKKTLNEDSLLDNTEVSPSELGVYCAKAVIKSLRSDRDYETMKSLLNVLKGDALLIRAF